MFLVDYRQMGVVSDPFSQLVCFDWRIETIDIKAIIYIKVIIWYVY